MLRHDPLIVGVLFTLVEEGTPATFVLGWGTKGVEREAGSLPILIFPPKFSTELYFILVTDDLY
jgi:hypothetical protein